MGKLEGVHPLLADKMNYLVDFAQRHHGLEVIITQGLRTFEEQDALYAKGRTTPGLKVTDARGGSSFHNYGLAVDFAIKVDGKLTWEDKIDSNESSGPDYDEVGKMGEEFGLVWGGRWKKSDRPHFQLTFGLSISDLRSGKRPSPVI
jgi:peptidoglycan L-alanyl-D-glutamate endopeptidase CwlK